MHCRFADVELLGRGAHRGLILYDVQGQLTGPLFHISFHTATSPPCFGSAVLLYAGFSYDMSTLEPCRPMEPASAAAFGAWRR